MSNDLPQTGLCKSWTLDCGLNRRLDHGLDCGLEYRLQYGLECGRTQTNMRMGMLTVTGTCV